MEEQKAQGKESLFREKNLEAMNTPETLNDYLRVTSPGVWLVLAAVIAVLIGAILWGIFGQINTTAQLAVTSSGGKAVCYVPYRLMTEVMDRGTVTIEGQSYRLQGEGELEMAVIGEETNPYIRVRGNLESGEVTVMVPVDATLEDGVYTAVAVMESLKPISLLLQ